MIKKRYLILTQATLAAVAIDLSATRDAHAAGTALDVQSARCTGMGSACTSFIDDSSAIYYNPAGIAQGKGIDAQIGDTIILPQAHFTDGAGNVTKTTGAVPPFNAYLSGGVTDTLSLGVGVFTPFGSTVKWPADWSGRSQIVESQLSTFYINPTMAYRIGPVRLGVGLQIVRATVDLKKQINFGSQEGSTEVAGGAWGAGANLGAQVEAVPKYLSLGATYRSAVNLDFNDGKAHFSNVPAALQGSIHDQAVTTRLPQPGQFAAGISSRPVDALVLDFDIVYYTWEKFHSVDTHFPNDASGTLDASQAKNWHNTVNYHLGGEGRINANWAVRAGAMYDPSPAPASTLSPDIPDTDRVNLSLGGSYYHPSGFHVDLGYQYIFLLKTTSTLPQFAGDYSGNVNIIGISVGYANTPKVTTRSYSY